LKNWGVVNLTKRFTEKCNASLRRKRPLREWPKHLRDNAIMTCAGPVAELRFCTERGNRIDILSGSVGDHRTMEAMTKAKPAWDLDRSEFEDSAWQRATNLIRQNWNLVTGLSEYISKFYDGWDEVSFSGRELRKVLTSRGGSSCI